MPLTWETVDGLGSMMSRRPSSHSRRSSSSSSSTVLGLRLIMLRMLRSWKERLEKLLAVEKRLFWFDREGDEAGDDGPDV